MTEPNGQVKRFGGNERPQSQTFELVTFTDDGDTNTHRFDLTPLIPAGQVTALMDALDDAPERIFGKISRLLSRVLNNTDGVSANWEYKEFEDPGPDDAEYDPDDPRLYYVGPDNEVHDAADEDLKATFTSVSAGSSRRRWRALMDPDNQKEAVNLGDMVDLAKWVIGLATDRPTSARTSSTGSRKPRR